MIIKMISDAHLQFSPTWVQPPPPILVGPTLHIRMDIQTDGDYTERVVTPFGTTRLKSGSSTDRTGEHGLQGEHGEKFRGRGAGGMTQTLPVL